VLTASTSAVISTPIAEGVMTLDSMRTQGKTMLQTIDDRHEPADARFEARRAYAARAAKELHIATTGPFRVPNRPCSCAPTPCAHC